MRVHRFIAIVVTALALTMTSAHVLEMPQKLSYDLDLYTKVNGTLYFYFAVVGGAYQILGVIATGWLWWRMRHARNARWMLVAANALALSFISWLILVEPVNLTIGDGAAWTQELRLRWELGHLVGFVLQLAGFVALVAATVRDLPGDEEDYTAAWAAQRSAHGISSSAARPRSTPQMSHRP